MIALFAHFCRVKAVEQEIQVLKVILVYLVYLELKERKVTLDYPVLRLVLTQFWSSVKDGERR